MEKARVFNTKRFKLRFILLLVLCSVLISFPRINIVKASETIYIRADGSIAPSTAPISSVDNITYIFTGSVNDEIVVERDNIVVDGAGYTLEGTGSGAGVYLSWRSNVTIQNMTIQNFNYGIYLFSSSFNNVSRNNITNNNYGVYIDYVYTEGGGVGNIISRNNITDNGIGICFYHKCNNNTIAFNMINCEIKFVSANSENRIHGNDINSDIIFDYDSNGHNKINNNKFQGSIYLGRPDGWGNDYNEIYNNEFHGSISLGGGASSVGACRNIIKDNNGTGSISVGIDAMDNLIMNNTGSWSLTLSQAKYNTVTENDLWGGVGIAYNARIHCKENSLSYNNIGSVLIDSYGADSECGQNTWSHNYYRDYNGTDADYDGIGNQPYVMDEVNVDNYPLMGLLPWWIRNLNTSVDYPFIQTAINSNRTLDGHTIKVDAGIYYENVVTNKSLTLIGENRRTVVDGNYTGNVIEVTASNITITGFSIRRSGVPGSGIKFSNVKNCDIYGNNITNNEVGIYLNWSSSNIIYHNNFVGNTEQVHSSNSTNVWDDGVEGNYWSDYEDRYPDAEEIDRSGVWSIPYVIDSDNRDSYPLMAPCPWFPLSDTMPPTISILSPENKMYPANDVPLTFAVSESTSWIGYNLDGQANATITGNTTLSGLSEGSHRLTVYAKDTTGNTGASEIVYFSIKTQQAEPFPIWIVGVVAIVVIGTAIATIFLWRRQK